MPKTRPIIDPKISQREIDDAVGIGYGQDFGRKFTKFKDKGCFDPDSNSQEKFRDIFYENKNERFLNVIRGITQFIPRELSFFRDCMVYAFGEKAASGISDDELLFDKVDILFAKLNTRSVGLLKSDTDPVQSILELVRFHRAKLVVKIEKDPEDKYRFPNSGNSPKIQKRSMDRFEKLTQGDAIKVNIRKDNDEVVVKSGPILLAIAYENNHQVGEQEIRAQLQRNVRVCKETKIHGEGDKDEIHWQCTADDGNYMSMKALSKPNVRRR